VKSAESMAIEVIRKLIMCAQTTTVKRVTVTVEDEVAMYINNKKRRDLLKMEDDHEVQVVVVSREDLSPEFLKFDCEDGNGREVRVGDI
jgi:ribonuclease E